MITIDYEILNKFRVDDHLVTTINYVYSGDINENITIDVYHFRPKTEQEVLDNILLRANSEKEKIVARKTIDSLLNNL